MGGFYNVDKTTGELIPVAGGTLYADTPVGTIQAFGGTAIPTGWLACSGQAISRTDYADLYAVIGTYYGNGNGTTTFNVPDLREATPKGTGLSGKSSAHYSVGGITLGQFVEDRIQGHWHDVVLRQSGGSKVYVADENLDNYNSDNLFGTKTRNVATDPISDGTNGTPRTGTTTEVKAVGVNFIIKAKSVGAPTDIIEGVKDALGAYSTTETVVGTWVDGKPIYRRVISLGTQAINPSESWIDIWTQGVPPMHYITNYELVEYRTTSSLAKGNSFFIIKHENSKVSVLLDRGWSESTSRYLIIEYTKTTD